MTGTLISQYKFPYKLVDSESGYDLVEFNPAAAPISYSKEGKVWSVIMHGSSPIPRLRVTDTGEPTHQSYSISAWIKQTNNNDRCLIGHSTESSSYHIWYEFGDIKVTFKRNNASHFTVTFTDVMVENIWTHYTATVDIIEDLATTTLYINSVQVDQHILVQSVDLINNDDFSEFNLHTEALVNDTAFGNVKLYYGAMSQAQVDFDYAETTDDILGGTATLENPISIIARTSIGSMGVANIDFIEKDLASKISTIISNHRKSVSITESNYGIDIMIGEIIQTPHQLTRYSYRVEEISRKLLRTPALTDPIKESGVIRHIGKDPVTSTKTIIDDRDKDFTVNVNVNDLVNFNQETTDQLKATPDFAGVTWLEEDPDDTFNSFAPLGTTGNISNCYFDNQTIAVADNQIGGEWKISGEPSFARGGLVVYFYYPIKVDNSPTKLEFNLIVAFRKLSHYLSANYPRFRVWDYVLDEWDEKYQLVAADVGGKSSKKDNDDVFGHDESPNANIAITIESNASNYTNKITNNTGSDEFNRYETKIFIQTFTQFTLIAPRNTIHFYRGELVIELDSEQDGLLELGKVGAVAATRLDFQDLQGRQPFMDGISNDDKYFVLDLASVMLGKALVNSGLNANFILDIDATGMSTLAIFQDFTDRSFWDLLQFVCTSLNAFWYINPSTKAITIRTTDKIEDTGIELDETDIYNFHDQIFNNNIDSSNLRTKIKVIGDKVDSGNVSISPEFGSTFGNETEIIDRADAETVTEVSDIANSQKVRHAKANRLMTFPINTTVNSKNLSALAIGKLITVKIPADGSLINYSGDNKILIYAMDYEKTERTAQEEIIYLQLQRRY